MSNLMLSAFKLFAFLAALLYPAHCREISLSDLLASLSERPDPLPEVHPWHLVNCINTEYTSQAHTWEEVSKRDIF